MTMLKALNWCKEAMNTKGLTPMYLFYLVKDGMLTMTDGRMWASHPWPSEDTFCAVGEPTMKLLERLPEPVTIKLAENDITFRSGRLKGTVKIETNIDAWPMRTIEDELKPIPDGLCDGLRKLRSFISDNAQKPWALCVLAHDDTLYATNNVAVGVVPELDLDIGEARTLIPNWAIDFILARETGLAYWCVGGEPGKEYLGFKWANGAWMRTQLADDPNNFPARIEDLIAKHGNAKHPLSDDWRRAWEDASALSANVVTIYKDRIVGQNKEKESEKTMDITIEIASPCPEEPGYSCWDPRFVDPVLQVATHWDTDQYPAPCPFRGEGIVGVVMGRRK